MHWEDERITCQAALTGLYHSSKRNLNGLQVQKLFLIHMNAQLWASCGCTKCLFSKIQAKELAPLRVLSISLAEGQM